MRMVHVCLAVTCHLHFECRMTGICYVLLHGGGTDTDMSQHRKSTLVKKILPPLMQVLEPATF